MNRRSFFKVVTGFVAGIFATSGKKRSGTRYCGESSTGIDPNSEWAKQKCLTLDEICRRKRKVSQDIYGEPDMLYSRNVWYDDTKAIQEAIDLAKDNGRIVYLPKGTYNLKYGIIV